jgi:DNA-binding MarR family transcriptional regulator
MLVIGKFFSEYFRHSMNKTGITTEHDFSMLELKGLAAFIDMRAEYTMSQLSRNAHLPLSNMTFIIKRLESKGIVLRQRSARDKRVVQVRLTQQGMELFERFVRHRVAELEKTMGKLSVRDQQGLVGALATASKIFQKLRKP